MKKRIHLIAGILFFYSLAWSQPTITSFAPTSGSVGTSVTITGTNFSTTPANNSVYFGAVKATVTAATANNLEVTVPAGSTHQPIVVVVGGLISYSNQPFLATFSGSDLDANSFGPKSDLTTGSSPFYSAVGDLDNDGKVDMAVANSGSNTLSIFRNTSTSGTISYASKQDFPTGTSPFSVAFADLDGDGKLDMVSVNNGSNNISVFRNTSSTGSISFGSAQNFTTGTGPQYAAVEDLDKDGKPDIVVANTSASTVSVLRSTSSVGSISFAAKADLGTASTPYFVAIGDLTNDGKVDLAVACAGGGAVSVFRSTSTSGTISFAARTDVTVGTSPRCVLIQDLNSDGKQDLVVANSGSNSITLLRNTTTSGLVSFSSILTNYSTGTSPYTLALADVNGDSKVDIVATTTSDHEVTILKNTTASSTFSFETGVDFATGSSPIGVSVADFDGDGKPDLLVVNNGVNGLSTLRNLVKTGQTISFAALAAVTYGDDEITLSATATSGLPVSFYSSNTAVATVSGNVVTIVGGGSTNIYALQAGNSVYAAAPDVIRSLTVNKANQTISFPALPGKVVGDAPFLLTATASSGLAVSYAYSNSAVASVSGNEVTINGVGNVTITASQFGNSNYHAATNVQQVLTVSKGSQTITFGAIPGKSYGDPNFNLSGSASSGLALSYSSSNTSVATISGTTVSIIGVGSTTITASQPGNTNYNAATNVQQVLTVTKANQTITFGTLPAKVLGDSPFSLSATASSNLSVSYVSSNTSVATVSGNTVTIVGVGTTTITASQTGDANYNAATSVQQTLTVYPTGQTITFNSLPEKVFGDPAFSLSATASSGLTVSYSSSNSSVATISGSTVTIVGVGTTTITASQAGNSNFAPATDVNQNFTVTKASQAITFNALQGKTFGDADFSLAATASSGLPVTYSSDNTSVATISGSTVTIVGAGTATITASQAGGTNFNAASDVAQSLTVNKAPQTITFNALQNKTYGDADFTLTATASSGLTVIYSSDNTNVATITESTVTIVGAGTATITASQVGNTNFNAASDVAQSLTVNKATQAITFNALQDKTYGDADFTLTATASSGLPVTYSSDNTSVVTISGSTVTIVGAGTATITASQVGNANFNVASDVAQSLTVNKATQAITFNALQDKTYGDADFTLTATASSGLPVTYSSDNTSVVTISGSTVTIVGAGTATITASQAGNTNFSSAPNTMQSLDIAKADQEITFGAIIGKAVGDPAFELQATASSGLTVSYSSSNTSVATISGNTVTILALGTTTITATQAGNANFNPAGNVQQVMTVKQNQTITFDPLQNKTYGDGDFTLEAVSSSGLSVTYSSDNTNVATISGSTVTIVGAGTATITASQVGNANFNPASDVAQSLTVNKATQTITFDALQDKTYGDADFTLAATASSGLAVTYSSDNTSVATISGNTVTIVGAGTATITASQAGGTNFSPASDVAQSLTVNKANQTITFSALQNKTYGDADFTLAATASSGLAVTYFSDNTSVATITGSTVTIVGAGTATITASQAGGTNFNPASDVAQSLTVIKANQTITFSALQDKTYGDADFTLAAMASSGLPVTYSSDNTNVATISGSTVTIVGAGSATITASQTGTINFEVTESMTQTLTVNKASLTAIADDLTITEGDAIPNLTISYLGFVNGEDESVLDTKPTLSTLATSESPAGTYDILVSGGSDTNYSFTLVSGTLTIELASPVLGMESESPLELYPNPSTHYIKVKATSESKVEIYDMQGQLVLTGTTNETIDIQDLPVGLYVIRTHNHVLRLIKR